MGAETGTTGTDDGIGSIDHPARSALEGLFGRDGGAEGGFFTIGMLGGGKGPEDGATPVPTDDPALPLNIICDGCNIPEDIPIDARNGDCEPTLDEPPGRAGGDGEDVG